MISRTGFTGDLGYELWTDPANAESMWDSIMEAGKELKIRPFGMHALEMTGLKLALFKPILILWQLKMP